MCEITEKWLKEGIEIGKQSGKMEAKHEAAVNLAKMGLAVDKIAQALLVSAEMVQQ